MAAAITDKKEKALRDAMAKYKNGTDDYFKSRAKLNDYLESTGKKVNRVPGEAKYSTSKSTTTPTTETPTTDTGANADGSTVVKPGFNLPEGEVSADVKPNLDTAEYFRQLFTNNVTPTTVSLTPEQDAATNKLLSESTKTYEGAGNIPPEVQAALDALNGLIPQAGQPIGQEDALLASLSKLGLEGLTPEQIQATREAGQSSIDRSLLGAFRGGLGQAANLGVGGPDAIANSLPAQIGAQNAIAQLERDLFLENIGVKQKATESALTQGNAISTRRFGQQQDATQNYFVGANDAYTQAQNNKLNSFKAMSDAILGTNKQSLDIQKTNNDSLNSFQLSQLGAFTGGLSYGDSVKTNKQLIDLQKKNVGGTSSSSSSSTKKSTNTTGKTQSEASKSNS